MAEEKYRFVYFDVRALGEPIRMIFAHSGTPYKDERIPWDYPNWFNNEKPKYDSTCGQVPVLYVDCKALTKSTVISGFLAKQFGLVGDNDWDNGKVDEVVSMCHDLFVLWITTMYERDPQRKSFMKTNYMDPRFKLCYAKLTKILEEKPGPFILGEKVTHADFWLANFISIWDLPLSGDRPVMPEGWPEPHESDYYIGMTKDYPALKKHLEAVESIPQIKEWIAKRHQTIS